MRKLDLANKVKDRVGGLSRKETNGLIDLLLATLSRALCEGKNVKVSGFGSFIVRGKKERRGRNPHTGVELRIPERTVLTFKPGQVLRDKINE